MWRKVNDAIRTGAVQAAEDIQTLVLTAMEVQTQYGREDKEHHGEIKHNHDGCLGRDTERENNVRLKRYAILQTVYPS